jgi:hypothetical protein
MYSYALFEDPILSADMECTANLEPQYTICAAEICNVKIFWNVLSLRVVKSHTQNNSRRSIWLERVSAFTSA